MTFRIVLVCLANVCRSPMAERLLAWRLQQAGVGSAYDVSSAGVRALVGNDMAPETRAELDRLGAGSAEFTARQFDGDHGRADLILAATRALRGEVLTTAPAALRRTFTIREFGHLAPLVAKEAATPAELVRLAADRRSLVAGHDLDLVDPIGRPAAVYREVADLLEESLGQIASVLAGLDPVAAP